MKNTDLETGELSDVSFAGKDKIHDRKKQTQGESEKEGDLPVEATSTIGQNIIDEYGERINNKGY